MDYVIGANPARGVYCMAACDDPRDAAAPGVLQARPRPVVLASTRRTTSSISRRRPASPARSCSATPPSPRSGRRVAEVITAAKHDMPAGHVLDGLGGFDNYGLAERARRDPGGAAAARGAAEGCRLTRAGYHGRDHHLRRRGATRRAPGR